MLSFSFVRIHFSLDPTLSYLVIRDGPKWSDVFRLVEGRTVTIGRAPTNQIVINDDRCSRHHAEVFSSHGEWKLRDLDSRNGVEISGQRLQGDYPLSPGDVFHVAKAELAFVDDLGTAFTESSEIRQATVVGDEHSSDAHDESVETVPLTGDDPTTITHRRGKTRYFDNAALDEPGMASKVGATSAKRLCKLAFDLADIDDIKRVAQRSLECLFESTNVDAGGVYLLRDLQANRGGRNLGLVASRSDHRPKYRRLSKFLAETVMREGEAVLARNIEGDSTLGSPDSQGEIEATSIICAPIRRDGQVLGLIHTYSTDAARRPNPDDLEFTLAVAESVVLALKNVSRNQELDVKQNEIEQLRQELGQDCQLIGSSQAMHDVHQEIFRAAPSRATVLIRGESGVGKELVARAVHFASPRKDRTFVCLNCAALSETLLESELFGHEKGAFTGATERKLGKFEAAHQGTLMLDEIGEMSESIQAKFLRVLEGHPFERVGGSEAISVDVRVIAATNRDLEKAVTQGKFRRDLYFRLNVVEILVPGLRKRGEDDIMELAHHFLARYNIETGRRLQGFEQNAVDAMKAYRWPGNVRELRNVVERAVVLARSDFIGMEDLNLSKLATASDTDPLSVNEAIGYEPLTLAEVEKRHIRSALIANKWNKSRTASTLGIERSTLDRKIRRYGLKRPSEK